MKESRLLLSTHISSTHMLHYELEIYERDYGQLQMRMKSGPKEVSLVFSKSEFNKIVETLIKLAIKN